MLNKLRYINLLLIFIVISSCSSKKEIIYLQSNKDNIFTTQFSEHIIKSGDVLDIKILTSNPETLISVNQNVQINNVQNRESLIFSGYIVNNEGYIDYSDIGKVNLKGLTLDQAKSLISEKLTNLKILIEPVIDIKILNKNFTILGEVNMPGKYYFDEPNYNVFQAIGQAGDLTINGLRKDIKIIRGEDGKKFINSIDLTKTDFISGSSFQIFSGDIIIVNPNLNRVKNAGIIGNSGTLLSLLSFLLSLAILNNN